MGAEVGELFLRASKVRDSGHHHNGWMIIDTTYIIVLNIGIS